MPYSNTIAGSGDQGSFTPFHLFAGEKAIVTTEYPYAANTAFAQFEVVAIVAGVITKLNPSGNDGSQIARAVTCQPIASTASPGKAPVYKSAFFNHEALVWPAAWDTLAERQQAVLGTDIEVGPLLGSTEY